MTVLGKIMVVSGIGRQAMQLIVILRQNWTNIG